MTKILDQRRSKGLQVIDGSSESRQRIDTLDEHFIQIWDTNERSDFLRGRFPGMPDEKEFQRMEDLVAGLDSANRRLSYKDLISYLASCHGIDSECSRFLEATSPSTVEGSFSLSLPGLKLLSHTLVQKDVEKWMKEFEGFFRRRGLLKKFQLLAQEAQSASCQNIEIFSELFAHLNTLSITNRTRLQQTFADTLSKFSNAQKVWNEAPWMELLPDPTVHMQDFFCRCAAAPTQGFLLPDQCSTVQGNFSSRLEASNWYERVESRQRDIGEILENLPSEALQPAPRIEFPAMILLQRSKGSRIKEGDNDAKCVDAERLWMYLRSELINRTIRDPHE